MGGIMSNMNQARLNLMHRYWNAANYLTVGQIYLQDNPLLREPLRPEHIKPRLLGHCGTSPDQNFVYVHLNRLDEHRYPSAIYIPGPGQSGPPHRAHGQLHTPYSTVYPLGATGLDRAEDDDIRGLLTGHG